MTRDEALAFCGRWLPLWTGNQPDELAALYHDDAFYRDPANPQGITGKAALLDYLRRLLARNPQWRWEADDVFPVEGGFVLRWRARIPVDGRIVEETGMDLLLLREGRITRNEVYFDRSALAAPTTAPAERATAAATSGASLEGLRRLFEHVFWADDLAWSRLVEAGGQAPAQALRLLAHVLAAERVWLLRLRGADASEQPIWPEIPLDEMRDLLQRNRLEYVHFLETLSQGDLDRHVVYRNSRGVEFSTRIVDILTHVGLHGSYHRGQIAMALRQAGAEPVNTDYIQFVREAG